MAERQTNCHPLLIDLTGERFGTWTVTARDTSKPYTATRRTTYWTCRCQCGTTRSIRGQHLRRGVTTNCGCYFKGIDLTGQMFGRLTILARSNRVSKAVYWTCRCECGTVKDVVSDRLRNGITRSCGCLVREVSARVNRKHGLTAGGRWSPGYSSWMTSGVLRPTNTRWTGSTTTVVTPAASVNNARHSTNRPTVVGPPGLNSLATGEPTVG